MYDQLRQLQRIENAFLEWESYREQVTHFLIKHTSPNHHIAIMGAGECNDIHIGQLADCVAHISLVDRDIEALERATKKYSVANNPRVQCIQQDFVGLSDEDFRWYADALIQEVRKKGYGTDVTTLAHKAKTLIEELIVPFKDTPLPNLGKKYDTVIVLGVHSQILSMLEWIWHIILQTIQKDEDTLRTYIINLNEHFVKRLNDALFITAREQIILGCELERIGRTGSVQGAIQCLEDMAYRCDNNTLTLGEQIILQWPFNKKEEVSYSVCLGQYLKPLAQRVK